VRRLKRLAQQHVFLQVNLRRGEIVGRAEIAIQVAIVDCPHWCVFDFVHRPVF
jgi:hypothetical protein